jgi:hypothetical protein
MLLDLGVNEFYKGKKKIHVSCYVRQQNTTRSGTTGIDKIDLNTTQLKLGAEYEIIPNLEIQLAGVFLTALGNEFLAQRNLYNEITFFKSYQTNLKESIMLGGINYQFSKYNCLKIQYQAGVWNNVLLPDNQYNISKVAIIYNLFF